MRRSPAFLLILIPALLIALSPSLSSAQGFRVDSLVVEGNRHVPSERVALEFGLEPGSTADAESIAEGVKRLHRSNRFAEIQVLARPTDDNGAILLLKVLEHPRVAAIEWEGLKKIEKKDLQEAIRVTLGSYLRPLLLAEDEVAILAHCSEKGYHAARLEVEREEEDGGLVALTFRLVEGSKTKIKSIAFEGTDGMDRGELMDVLGSRPKRLINPMSWFNSNEYQPDSVSLDVSRLMRAYNQAGFLDATMLETKREFNEKQDEVTLTYVIEEGPRYDFGELSWQGNSVLPDTLIQEFLPFEPGEHFDGWGLDRGIALVSEALYNRGYLYNQVQPERNIEDRRVNLSLHIVEGPLAKVREVVVAGNTRTLDKVIRREVKIFPGELFSQEKVIRSHRDIFMLRFFDDVQIEPRSDPNTGDVDLVFRVLERSTGNFGAGVTYSETTSFTGFIQVGAENFRGRGQSLNFQWEFGSRVNLFNVSFTEPWFRDRPITLSGNVYRSRSNLDLQYYKDEKLGFSFGAGRPFPWLEYARVSGTYRLQSIELYDFSDAYVAAGGRLLEREWPEVESSITFTFWRNSTDSPFLPSKGTRFRFSTQFAGGLLGGNLSYQKYLSHYTWYQKLLGPLVLRFHQTLGLVDGLNNSDQVPDQERFRLGGNRIYPLRGYQDYSVVPDGNNSYYGGRAMTTGTVEVVLGVSNSVQIIAPFFDFGGTWNSMGSADFTTLKRSVGFGARIEIPMMGVMGFDWGYPLDPAPGFDKGRFHFKMGTDF